MAINLKINANGSMQRAGGGALRDVNAPQEYLSADSAAPAFSAVTAYEVGDVCSYGHTVYRCILAFDDSDASDASEGSYTTPDNDPTHWQKTTVVSGRGQANLDYCLQVDPTTGGIYYTTQD